MNQRNPTKCSSCKVYSNCFLICCPIAYLCLDCVFDEDLLNASYECPKCLRTLSGMYDSIMIEARIERQQMAMGQNSLQYHFGNSKRQMSRTNSYAEMNMRNQQMNTNQQMSMSSQQMSMRSQQQQSQMEVEEQEFQFVHNSNNHQANIRRNNFNQHSETNGMTNQQQQRNNFTGYQQQQQHQQQQQRAGLRDVLMNQSQGQQNMRGNNYQMRNNFSGQQQGINGMRNNMNMNSNNFQQHNNFSNNFRQQNNFTNHQQQQNNFTNNQQQFHQQNNNFTFNQASRNNSFTANIREAQQQQQLASHQEQEEFFFQDQLQKKQRSRGLSTTSNKAMPALTNSVSKNLTSNQSQKNNPFSQQNNFQTNHRNNISMHINNFNSNQANDQSDEFFFNDQRMVKSATKSRRIDFSPSNSKRNNFKAGNTFSNQHLLSEEKSEEKDLSPTFGGEHERVERETFEFERKGSMIKEEKNEGMRMKKSDSAYSLGHQQ